MFKRLKRCCSSIETFTQAIKEYTEYLTEREYSLEVINKAIDKVKDIDRNELIGEVNTGEGNPEQNFHKKLYPLVMKFNPKLPNMAKIINSHKHILELNELTNKLFPSKSIIVTYKNERDIKSLLTSNKHRSKNLVREELNTVQGGCISCKNCTLCSNFLLEGDTVHSYHTAYTHKIQNTLTCETRGVYGVVVYIKNMFI